jgi:hypothetical protein
MHTLNLKFAFVSATLFSTLAVNGAVLAGSGPFVIQRCGAKYCVVSGIDYCISRAPEHYDVDPKVLPPGNGVAPPGTISSANACVTSSNPPDTVWCEVSEDGNPLIYACVHGVQQSCELPTAGLVSAETIVNQYFSTSTAPSVGDPSIKNYSLCILFYSNQGQNHRYFAIHVKTR